MELLLIVLQWLFCINYILLLTTIQPFGPSPEKPVVLYLSCHLTLGQLIIQSFVWSVRLQETAQQ